MSNTTDPKPENGVEKLNIAPETTKSAAQEVYPENDRKLPRNKRIIAFVERRGGMEGFVRLNEFLKSLYPPVKPGERPLWSHQGEMRNLKQTLTQMKERREIEFSNNNFERLGSNYHTEVEKRRMDYNINDFPIEARIPY